MSEDAHGLVGGQLLCLADLLSDSGHLASCTASCRRAADWGPCDGDQLTGLTRVDQLTASVDQLYVCHWTYTPLAMSFATLLLKHPLARYAPLCWRCYMRYCCAEHIDVQAELITYCFQPTGSR